MDRSKYYLELHNVSVGYHGKALIKDIEVSVDSGEIVTLIGPNGAGKSTILKNIVGQLEPLDGVILLEQQDALQMTAKDKSKKMSILMTDKVDVELLTCFDIVAMGRYPYTNRMGILSEDDKHLVMEALKMVHALDLADELFDCISDGQKQRVMLARCICQNPKLIILDEPTSFLDIRHKLELLHILKSLAKEQNIAIFMSLHEIDLAQKLSDKIICVDSQKISYVGAPEEIMKSDFIEKLYGITKGTYSAEFGSLELAANTKKPQVFVIGGNGSGIEVYRKLHRKDIAFAVGILQKNDVDYWVAKNIASEIIAEDAYEDILADTFEMALKCMEQCNQVICTLDKFGKWNQKNNELYKLAKSQGKLVNDI